MKLLNLPYVPRLGPKDKCIAQGCTQPVKYVSPDYLCTYHWCMWWTDSLAKDIKDLNVYDELFAETYKFVKQETKENK